MRRPTCEAGKGSCCRTAARRSGRKSRAGCPRCGRPSERRTLVEFVDGGVGAVGIGTEDVVFLQIDDVLAVDGLQFGQNGGAGHHLGAGGAGQGFDGFDGFAGGDDVVDERHALAADFIGVAAVEPEGLFLLGGHGEDGVGNGGSACRACGSCGPPRNPSCP